HGVGGAGLVPVAVIEGDWTAVGVVTGAADRLVGERAAAVVRGLPHHGHVTPGRGGGLGEGGGEGGVVVEAAGVGHHLRRPVDRRGCGQGVQPDRYRGRVAF